MEGSELADVTYDYLLKIIIVGDSSTGKTCLVSRLLSDHFRENVGHTIGVSFQSTLLRLPSTVGNSSQTRALKLQLWDTAGQERFRSVARQYYRGSVGALLCYDITRRATFDSVAAWLADARALASPDLVCVLVGTKLDRDEHDEREVPWLEASRFAREEGLLFVEVSAMTGESVDQPFLLLARSILLAIEQGRIDPAKPGSGVTFGEHALKRHASWSSIRPRTVLESTADRVKSCC